MESDNTRDYCRCYRGFLSGGLLSGIIGIALGTAGGVAIGGAVGQTLTQAYTPSQQCSTQCLGGSWSGLYGWSTYSITISPPAIQSSSLCDIPDGFDNLERNCELN